MILNKIISYWQNSQIIRFLFVGGTTVFIDFIVYTSLIYTDFETSLSKGVGFLIGTVFAYFANRKITFRSSSFNFFKFILFIILYFFSLFVNIFTNEIILILLGIDKISYLIAFLIATSFSACINFIGMKYIIFQKK
mgnify:CR=1